MSIASEISRINNNIASAYSECNSKGATMPQIQNSSNLANTIASIPTGSAIDITNGKLVSKKVYSDVSANMFIANQTVDSSVSVAIGSDNYHICAIAYYGEKVVAIYYDNNATYIGLFEKTPSAFTLLSRKSIGYMYYYRCKINIIDNVVLFRTSTSNGEGFYYATVINNDDTLTTPNRLRDYVYNNALERQCVEKINEDTNYIYYLEITLDSTTTSNMCYYYYKLKKSTNELEAISVYPEYARQNFLPSQSQVTDYTRYTDRAKIVKVNNNWYVVTANNDSLNLFQFTFTTSSVTFTYKATLSGYPKAVLREHNNMLYVLYSNTTTSTLNIGDITISNNTLVASTPIDTTVANTYTDYVVLAFGNYKVAYIYTTSGRLMVFDTELKQTFTNSSLVNPITAGYYTNNDLKLLLKRENSSNNYLNTFYFENNTFTSGQICVKPPTSSATSFAGLTTQSGVTDDYVNVWVYNS